MKKLYTFLILAFTVVVGNAQIINFADANFKQRLMESGTSSIVAKNLLGSYFRIDSNFDNEISVAEASQVSWIYIDGGTSFFVVSSINEISNFVNLKYLNCQDNLITAINVTGLSALEHLLCTGNQLTSLDVNGLSNLQELRCGGVFSSLNLNGLTSLNAFVCSAPLISIDLSSLINLDYLSLGSTQLTSIDLSPLANHLNQLSFPNNPNITSIDLSMLTSLTYISCYNNSNLASVNINGLVNLNEVTLSNNQSSSMDFSSGFPNISYLNIAGNHLSTIDISMLPNLATLDCRANNPLTSLFVKNGRLNSLNISNNPNLQYICADENKISSFQLQVNQSVSTNCHINSYCSFTPGGTFYTIQGSSKFDVNGDGCDASDIIMPLQKINISSGIVAASLISDISGNYSIPVLTGTHTITPQIENPTYFIASPASATITFPTAASPLMQNFCITGNGVHNDLEVNLIPINISRPGFNSLYKIIYKNKGTGTQSGTVNLTFDDTKMDLVSATPINISSSNNMLSWSFSNIQPFETKEILFTMNLNSPSEIPAVNGGDVLSYTATIVGAIDETPIDNTSVLNQTMVNSFDPNDKTCLEGTTVSPDTVGKYVHYVIRFENTGTANAQNIVVKDIIDTAKYDISSLVPLSGSATFTTRIINTNQVEFIFQNINLPFTAGTNTGYVAFKIKTKPTLVVGDTFSNAANIYFDYNFPVVTNTATTTIATLGTPDFEFSSVFCLSPVPTKNVLTITTKQNVIMSSLSIYNGLGQLMQVNTNPNEAIDVSGLKTGSYFIRIVSDKGTVSGKFLKE